MKQFVIFSTLFFLASGFGFSGTLTVIHGIPGDSLGLERELEVDVYVNESYETAAFSWQVLACSGNQHLRLRYW